jgi:pimeloyl-ACP methyl ester carboxylesterase
MKSYRYGDGAAIRYFDFRPWLDRAIVFIHGLGCAGSYEYPPVCADPALSGFRTIVPDLLGFGYSDKPPTGDYSIDAHAHRIADMIEGLGLGEFAVYGHSMGGAIALAVHSLLGDKINKLIISEGNLDPGGGPLSSRIAEFGAEGFAARGRAEIRADALADGNGAWVATFDACSDEAAYHGAKSLVDGGAVDWRAELYRCAAGAAFIFSEQWFDASEKTELESHGVRVEVIPGVGHSMALDDPGALAGRVSAILG